MISLLLPLAIWAAPSVPHKTKFYITTRDDYCLQGPYDGNHLGNYRRTGDVEARRNQLTLGLGKPDRAGALWSNTAINAENWQITLTFSIKGQDVEHGGHGLAFWFTKEPGKLGPFYGNQASFEGFALIADTYNGDEQPIFALMGSAEQQFKMGDLSKAVGKCVQAIRNQEHPLTMRMSWMSGSLKVEFDGLDGAQSWRTCMEIRDLNLPNEGYFGLSASTSKSADRVEILSMKVQEIHSASSNAELMHEIRRLVMNNAESLGS